MQRNSDLFYKKSPYCYFAPIVINDKTIEIVTTIKSLGLNIPNNLKWNGHIEEKLLRKLSLGCISRGN
jgi:hypothetical protein